MVEAGLDEEEPGYWEKGQKLESGQERLTREFPREMVKFWDEIAVLNMGNVSEEN